MTSLSTELQQVYTEFERSLNIIGWCYKNFCFYYYQDIINESYDDEIESSRFYEKQKKKKQRKTHSLNELGDFIHYLTNHPDFRKKEFIKPYYLSDEDLSLEFEQEMKKISVQITEMITNKMSI